MSDKVRILLGLGAFLVALAIVVGVSSVYQTAQDGIAPWAKYVDYTTDDTPVEIITGGPAGQTKFRIPKAYLPIGQHQKGGVQDFIAIEAAWPDMRPWVFTKYERGSPTGRGNKSERYEIYIKIGPGRDYMGKRHEEELKERRLQYNHELDIGLIYLGSPIIQKDDGRFYLQGDGLHNFYIKSESSDYKLDENVGFYITCINQEKYPKARCTVDSDVNEIAVFSYSFPSIHLEGWAEIDRRVRDFVTSLVVEQRP